MQQMQADNDPDSGDEPAPWNNPQSFIQNMGLPMPSSFPTPEEVRKEARDRSREIFTHWNLLNRAIECYEAVIQKRWLKRTREQRKKILLTAWPNMSATHRPDFEAFAREKGVGLTRFRDAYLWPHINLEDLLKPKLLLIFLNARGRNPPSAFAAADSESCRFATTSGKVMPPFLNEHTMMFTGRNTPETYGELIAWDDNDDAFDWLHTREVCIPATVSRSSRYRSESTSFWQTAAC